VSAAALKSSALRTAARILLGILVFVPVAALSANAVPPPQTVAAVPDITFGSAFGCLPPGSRGIRKFSYLR
jgi:hypothetical protein